MKKLSILFVITCLHFSLSAQQKEPYGEKEVAEATTFQSVQAAPLNGKAYAIRAVSGVSLLKDDNNLPLAQFGVTQDSSPSARNRPIIFTFKADPLLTAFWLAFENLESEPMALMIPGTQRLPPVRVSNMNTL